MTYQGIDYQADGIEKLKRDGRFEARLASERGVVADLRRDGVIVHVGKPIGAVSGWVGPVFWQVWVDGARPTGSVSARIDRGAQQEWTLDAGLSVEELLATAKDRAIDDAETIRRDLLAAAVHRVEQLEGATD